MTDRAARSTRQHPAPFAAALRRAQITGTPLVLDGAAGTQLEALGADLSGGLWSARLLAEDPGLVAQLHAAYVAAGAQVIESVSYQASPCGLAEAGFTAAEVRDLLARSWELAAAAAAGGVFAAASIGPYGAYLADGSEYTGDYDTGTGTGAAGASAGASAQRSSTARSNAVLERFHRERIEILYAAGARLFAVETIPRLDEALAVAAVMAKFPAAEWWLSFSLAGTDIRDSADTCTSASAASPSQHSAPQHSGPQCSPRIADGTSLQAVLRELRKLPFPPAGVGVNCCPGSAVEPAVRLIGAAGFAPIAYPNSGEVYNASAGRWDAPTAGDELTDPAAFAAAAREWADAGAVMVGGCCRTTPQVIRALAHRESHPSECQSQGE